MIGKTGTAQYVNAKTGRYYGDETHAIKSFAGMWPKDDPEVIVFISVKDSLYGSSAPLYNTVKPIVKNVSKYLEIYDTAEDKTINNYKVDNYINRDLSRVKQTLKKNKINYLVLGNGNKVINQYPEKENVVNVNDTIILLTNDSEYKMPDLKGYSKKQVRAVCNLLNIKCTFKGYGYVSSQSVKKNTAIKKDTSVKFEFKN